MRRRVLTIAGSHGIVLAAWVFASMVGAPSHTRAAPGAPARDAYSVLLDSPSLAEQRAALATISAAPRPYLPRLRQSLRDYGRLVSSEPQAANRAVVLATYLRDTVFVRLLVESLGKTDGDAGCERVCPAVLALTVYAAFGGWTPPVDLNPGIPAIRGFQSTVERMPQLSLAVLPVRSPLSGADGDAEVKAVEGKTEPQLIEMAGPRTSSPAVRRIAALALEATVASSVNRRDLYLLAMNDMPGETAHEYRRAVYEAIYRAEFARTHGR